MTRLLYDDSLAVNPAGTGTFVRGLRDALAARKDLQVVTPRGALGAGTNLDVGAKGLSGRIGNSTRHLRYYGYELQRQARTERCQVIFCPTALGPLGGRIPSVITVFDLSPLTWSKTMDRVSGGYIATMLRLGMRRSTAVCTISEAVADEIRQRFPRYRSRPLGVAYPGPNPGLLEADPLVAPIQGGPFLLMVGTLEPRKNQITVLRALADHVRRRPESSLRLVLAGSAGWLYEPLIRALDELGLRSRVSLLGKVELGTLKWLYQHAEALLFPSLYEGFGLPVLEALCLSCPVIAARIPSVVEITGEDGAILLPPTDIRAWAASIDAVEERSLPAAIITNGSARAQRFTWAACATSVRDLVLASLETGP